MNLRAIASVVFLPGLLVASVGSALALLRAGVGPDLVVVVVSVAGTASILFAQRWMPYEPSWRPLAADLRIDLPHLVVSSVLTGAAVRAMAAGGVQALALRIERGAGHGLWPGDWPLLLQVLPSVLIGDFFSYWNHRLLHTVPSLWPIHAAHHSSPRMHALIAVRSHPINSALTSIALTIPALLLGAGPEVLALHAIFNTMVGYLRHSNAAVTSGPLSWLLSTPEMHRWHHSLDPREAHTNFGTDTAIWDLVFGTWYNPSGRDVRIVGVLGMREPATFLEHMSVPFRPARFLSVGQVDDVPPRAASRLTGRS